MSTISDRARAAIRHNGVQCQTCAWLSTMAPAAAADWREALSDLTIQATALARVAHGVYLNLGTGIAATLVVDGHVVDGAHVSGWNGFRQMVELTGVDRSRIDEAGGNSVGGDLVGCQRFGQASHQAEHTDLGQVVRRDLGLRH